jgi:hypothetical protein
MPAYESHADTQRAEGMCVDTGNTISITCVCGGGGVEGGRGKTCFGTSLCACSPKHKEMLRFHDILKVAGAHGAKDGV